jgi:NTE family protein
MTMIGDLNDKAANVQNRRDGALLKSVLGQIVLVFQGGGALGAYQVGVYEALHEAGIEPDWVIGTSIGAINAALIAGNPVEHRLSRLEEFWRRVERGQWMGLLSSAPGIGPFIANSATVASGLEAFFSPNPLAFMSALMPLGPEKAGYCSTAPLSATLRDLVNEDALNSGAPRITVGAANITTGAMHYLDSRESCIRRQHILASGALPPAFPAVRVDGDLCWDGGILSNTPVEAVFDDHPRHNSLVFSVQLWHPRGAEPSSIWQVMSRQKDVQFASRTESQIARQKQLHMLRHIIAELASKLSEEQRKSNRVKMLASYGCVTRMHVVRLLAPQLGAEDQTKDIDFNREGIRRRRAAGRDDTLRVLESEPWRGEFDPMEGFIPHELDRGVSSEGE